MRCLFKGIDVIYKVRYWVFYEGNIKKMLFCETPLLNYAMLRVVSELTAILQANFLPLSCPPRCYFVCCS